MSLEFCTWNINDGFVDGMMRGWRSTFLTDMDYTNLKEGGRRGDAKTKEDFEDMRLTLQETDYGNFLQNEPSLDPKLIALRATQKWVTEFKYFRTHATGNLAKFMDYITYEYMIDNILDLMKAATSAQTVDMEAVFENCHPLGMVEQGVMKSILAYDNLAEEFHALYRTVLIDTPVGKYFTRFLQDIAAEDSRAGDPDHVRATFTEIPLTIIESSIKKAYIEDFYDFCQSLGGESAVVMGEILSTRADVLTINITYNSLNTDFSRSNQRFTRESLFPSFGRLYPEAAAQLAKAEDEDQLRRTLVSANPEYAAIWDSAPVDARGIRDITDAFFHKQVKLLESAFDGQFHYSPFYAYCKLKEQEVKNIAWIATCLEHGVYSEVDRIIPVFTRVEVKGR